MLWVKAFHVIFMVTWFAGLFYLPRLFVYHAQSEAPHDETRFKLMEARLYRIMTIGAAGTVVFGLWLLAGYGWQAFAGAAWLHVKLALAGLLIGYHAYLGRLVRLFEADANRHGHVFYRYLNELPSLFLVAMVLLAVVKPF